MLLPPNCTSHHATTVGISSTHGLETIECSIALGALAVAVIGYLFTQSADSMERKFARRIVKSRVYPS